MALTPKQRELKQKRKQAKRPKGAGIGSFGLLGEGRPQDAAKRFANFPIDEVLAPSALFETGIGNLAMVRRAPDGTYGIALVLLDVFCLGVKNAFFRVAGEEEWAMRRERIISITDAGEMESWHPSCWRKLVEGAVAYAKDLGFDPHPDYREVVPMFGDIDASACPEKFEFGKEGKPFYVSGPNDTPTRIRQIVKQLERRKGEGNFHLMLNMGDRFVGTPGDE